MLSSLNRLFLLVFIFSFVWLQCLGQSKRTGKIVNDRSIKIGKLNNGFSYFLKETNEKTIAINFVVKVGHSHEQSDQKGLAHLLEHLAFRSTRDFPNALNYFRERLGTRYRFSGTTGARSTRYYTTIDSTRFHFLPELLKFYRNIAHTIELNSSDIDAERRIVLEESRALVNTEDFPLIRKMSLPRLMGKTSFTPLQELNPNDNLLIFDTLSLYNFYEQWYRPNFQGIIIVGAFDVAKTERLIKKLFSDLKPTKHTLNIPEAVDTSYFKWKNQVECIVDNSLKQNTLEVYYKLPHITIRTEDDLKSSLYTKLFNQLMELRSLNQNEQSSTAISFPSYTVFTGIGPKFDLIKTSCVFKSDPIIEPLSLIFNQHEIIRRFGFSESEFCRAKDKLLNSNELFDSPTNMDLSLKIVDGFVERSVILTSFEHRLLIKRLISEMEVEEFNLEVKSWLNNNNNNRDIFLFSPDSTLKGKLAQINIRQLEMRISKEELAKYSPKSDQFLSFDLLQPQQIPRFDSQSSPKLRVKKNDLIDAESFFLDNGIEVVLKKTLNESDKNGVVLLKSINPVNRGRETYIDRLIGELCSRIVSHSGIIGKSDSELKRFLSFNEIDYVTPYSLGHGYGFDSRCQSRSLEKVLQLIYLYSSTPTKIDTVVFKKIINEAKSDTEGANNYNHAFLKKIDSLFNDKAETTSEILARINSLTPNHVITFFEREFSLKDNSKFVIVGDFDLDSIRSLTRQYLGAISIRHAFVDSTNKFKSKSEHQMTDFVFYAKNIGRSEVRMILEDSEVYSALSKAKIAIMSAYIKLILMKRLRDQEAGVYALNANLYLINRKRDNVRLDIDFTCAPEIVSTLIKATEEELKKLKTVLIDSTRFERLRLNAERELENNFKTNEFWISFLSENPSQSFDHAFDELYYIRTITPRDIKDLANSIFRDSNLHRFLLEPY